MNYFFRCDRNFVKTSCRLISVVYEECPLKSSSEKKFELSHIFFICTKVILKLYKVYRGSSFGGPSPTQGKNCVWTSPRPEDSCPYKEDGPSHDGLFYPVALFLLVPRGSVSFVAQVKTGLNSPLKYSMPGYDPVLPICKYTPRVLQGVWAP